MSLVNGTRLGPYEIQSSIGAGGMGEVYRAKDSRLGREVALKILPESFARDADRLRRFEQEARAVAALNHPNILAIYDIGEQNGTPFLVSELLEGHTLRTELEGGAMSHRKAVDSAAQIAQGLAAAHAKNITHRDLKPDNVFVSKDGRVKILDFGLAKQAVGPVTESEATLTGSQTEAGVVMGTAGYMAPEQVRGTAVDSRTDIFAFGAVLYEMISGQRAFRRDTTAETMTAILKEDPPELTDLTHPVAPGLERIVRRCLEKQLEQRFQSAKDLAFALEALTGTSSKSVAEATIQIEKTQSPWLPLAALAVLMLALGAGAAWYLHPSAASVPEFTQVSFHRGSIIRARFAPDGKTVVYSASLAGAPADTYVIRDEFPESTPAGLNGGLVLSVSHQGQIASILRPHYFAHFQWIGTLATSPLGGGAPREILEHVADADFSPDGNGLAVVVVQNSKWQLQYPIGKILLDTSDWKSDLRVSPDGEHVAFFSHPAGTTDDRGDIIVSDRAGHVQTLSSGWAALEGLTWSPSGKEVWFSAAQTSSQFCVYATSLSGKTRTLYCGTAATLIEDVTPSGRALVGAGDQRVAMSLVKHDGGHSEVRDLTWLDNSYGPRLSENGSVVLFSDQSSQSGTNYYVYVRKSDGSPAVRVATGGLGSDLSPDGKSALVLLPGDSAARIQVVPVGPGQTRILHWDGVQPSWAHWSRDGQQIFFVGSETGKGMGLYLTNPDGSAFKRVSSEDDFPDLTPDGRFYLHAKDGNPEAGDWALHSISDNTIKPVRGIHPGEFPIAWASDSQHVYTQTTVPGGAFIYRVNVETGQRELWQELRPKDSVGLVPMRAGASITPDGGSIAFTSTTLLGQLYRSENLK